MKKIAISIAMVLLMLLATAAARTLVYPMIRQEETDSVAAQEEKAEDYAAPDTKELESYGLGEFETTLPVLYIDTQGNRVTKERRVWATVAVLEADEDGQSVLEQPDYQETVTIKYRGASSYTQFDKNQYRIKFYKEEGSSKAKDVSFLGMGANSEWVLNGPYLDKTLLRNRLVYSLGQEIFEWAPDTRYVEVFVDGAYQGVYLAVEPVANGESRLRLSEFGLLSGETAYIVVRDRENTDEDPLNVYGKTAGKTNNELYISYPSASNLTDTQRDWIERDISRFEEVLYGDNFADPEIGYAAYIDVDHFVDYVLINELFMNNDAGDLSTYIYKELGGKFQLAIWDYNNCIDNYQWFAQDYTEFFTQKRSWLSRLLQDRSFIDRLVSRYKELRQSTFSDAYMERRIQAFQEELGDAVARNFAVWGYSFDQKLLIGDGREIDSYENAMEQLRSGLKKRAAYLDEHLEDLYESCIN